MLATMGREIVRVIVGSPNLRRVVAAFAGFNLADWARWFAILASRRSISRSPSKHGPRVR
jgi:hypothetical protein